MKISIELGLRALRAFLEREWRLALPVALAFLALPPLVFGLALPQTLHDVPATIAGIRALGLSLPWWTMPAAILGGLVSATGAFALMALVLIPRITVGEAIALAVRRLPVWIGAALLVGVGMFLALVVAGLLLGLLRGAMALLMFATMGVIVAASLYLVLLMPVIVEVRGGPLTVVRRGLTVYRGALARIAAGLLLFLFGCWLVSLAVQLALGSVLLLIGDATGVPELGRLLVALLGALVAALEWGAFYLFVAFLYRQRTAG